MLVKTILNKVYPLKSFVYKDCRFSDSEEGLELEIAIKPRKNGKKLCGKCQQECPGYDTQESRRFQFIYLWAIAVFFVYAPRRVACPKCGVVVEHMPWANGKSSLTIPLQLFLAHWAKKFSWVEVSNEFGVSWHQVYESVRFVVSYGLKNRVLEGIRAIGIDEIMVRMGQYVTLVYQIDKDCRRLLWIGKGHSAKTLLRFFVWFKKDRYQKIEFVCSDMWKAYRKVIKKKIPQALHILDRFHIVANLNKALNLVRIEEARRLKAEDCEEVLKGSRWCFLKKPQNLTKKQKYKLQELLKYNLKTVRAYLLKEDFSQFWKYKDAKWAGKFLDAWCTRVMRSKIEPLKKQAKTLRKHRELILNWFIAKKEFNSGIVEGFNCNAKLAIRKARGFRTDEALEMALFHQMGKLPEPDLAYQLW